MTRGSFTHPRSGGGTFSQGSAAPAFTLTLLGAAGREGVTCSGKKTQPGHAASPSAKLGDEGGVQHQQAALRAPLTPDSCRGARRTPPPAPGRPEFSQLLFASTFPAGFGQSRRSPPHLPLPHRHPSSRCQRRDELPCAPFPPPPPGGNGTSANTQGGGAKGR